MSWELRVRVQGSIQNPKSKIQNPKFLTKSDFMLIRKIELERYNVKRLNRFMANPLLMASRD
jgi:hypothetical protein